MPEILALAAALVAGGLLGAFFFGGLWWTVQKGMMSERPAFWFLGSLLLRTSTILAGFYFVSRDHWTRLAACLLGFLIARFIVVKRFTHAGSVGQAFLPRSGRERTQLETEANRAP